MADKSSGNDAKHLETLSVEHRKVIGQAIIDGLLMPAQVSFGASVAQDYNQGTGNYNQKCGDHKQGPGDYTQACALPYPADLVTNVIRELGIHVAPAKQR